MRLVPLVIFAVIGAYATVCGGNGEPFPADTPRATEGVATPLVTLGPSPTAADIDIDAALLRPDDLPEDWQFQRVDKCGGAGPYASLCPSRGVIRGKMTLPREALERTCQPRWCSPSRARRRQ